MASQNDFVQGINLAGELTVSGADLEQLVREAVPNSHVALNLTGATPNVTDNARYSRYLYYPSPGDWPKYYNTTSATWVNIPLADDIVTTGIIADGSVTLAKIDHTAGSALQYLRVNASADGVEWTTFTLNDASVTTAKLVPGTTDQVLVTNDAGTAATWSSADSWFTSMSQVVGLGNIKQTSATAQDVIAWNGSTWAPAGVETLVPTNSIALDKLTVTGTAGQVVRVNSGATAFEVGTFGVTSITPGSASQVLQTNSAGTAAGWATLFTKSPATSIVDSGVTTYTPSPALTYTPKIIRCVLKLNASQTDIGYDENDELDLVSFSSGNNGDALYPPPMWFDGNAYSFNVMLAESTNTGPILNHKTTRLASFPDVAKWSVYFIYSNF